MRGVSGRALLDALFGATAQIVVGATLLLATVAQTTYWTFITPPTLQAIFLVSMEALAFGAYGIIATGLGYRKTEHVSSEVIEEIKHADEVEINRQ